MLSPPRASAGSDVPPPTDNAKLIRAIGRWSLTALVINNIIGSGIFGLPDDVARLVGPAGIWAYVIAAVGAGIILLIIAELASQFREAGGPYMYAREAFGPLAGIQTAWFAWLARIASAAAMSNIFIIYLGEFWPAVTASGPRAMLLVAVFTGLVIVNIRGVRQGALVSNVFTVAKVLPLVLFVVVGFILAPRLAPSAPVAPGPVSTGAWIDALVVLLFAFGGCEAAVLPASEAKNPRRDMPFALMSGFALVAVIYISVHVVVTWSVPGLAHSERPLADAARTFAGEAGAKMIALGAVLSTFGGLCASVLTAPRIVFALAERGDFPRIFAAVHPRFRTPYAAILAWAVLGLGLALWGNFIWNAVLSISARLFTYGMSCGALVQFRRRHPEADAWRAPAGPLLACIGAGFCVVLILRLKADQAAIIAGIAALAAVNWLAVRRGRSPRMHTNPR